MMQDDSHDLDACYGITGAYHCPKCGSCCSYLGCPQCEPEAVQRQIDEMHREAAKHRTITPASMEEPRDAAAKGDGVTCTITAGDMLRDPKITTMTIRQDGNAYRVTDRRTGTARTLTEAALKEEIGDAIEQGKLFFTEVSA